MKLYTCPSLKANMQCFASRSFMHYNIIVIIWSLLLLLYTNNFKLYIIRLPSGVQDASDMWSGTGVHVHVGILSDKLWTNGRGISYWPLWDSKLNELKITFTVCMVVCFLQVAIYTSLSSSGVYRWVHMVYTCRYLAAIWYCQCVFCY